jgi:hypothetical protein
MQDDQTPTLDTGLTVIRTPDARSGALYRLTLETLRRVDGETYWLDARNAAMTYPLYERARTDRLLQHVRIARAFTAYQHHSLARRVVRQATTRTAFVVAPNVAALYRDDDVPEYERRELLDSTLALLSELGRARDVPVLVTDARGDALTDAVVDGAESVVTAERTDHGYRFEGGDFETTVYWCDGFWQTTIPYWVDLFGAVDEAATTTERPVVPPAVEV